LLTNSTHKPCSTCKRILPATEFYPHKRGKFGLQPNCRTCSRQWHRDRPDYIRRKNAEFKKKNPNYARNWWRKTKYGATVEQLDALRKKQNSLCVGCLATLTDNKECVDHCHKTGIVRGLLCDSCNVSIGRLGDNPETLRRLADYLESHHLRRKITEPR
jgi:hypothetical protein